MLANMPEFLLCRSMVDERGYVMRTQEPKFVAEIIDDKLRWEVTWLDPEPSNSRAILADAAMHLRDFSRGDMPFQMENNQE